MNLYDEKGVGNLMGTKQLSCYPMCLQTITNHAPACVKSNRICRRRRLLWSKNLICLNGQNR